LTSIGNVFGIKITQHHIDMITRQVTIGSGLVAFVRWALFRNISLIPKSNGSIAVCIILLLCTACFISNKLYSVPASDKDNN